MRGVSPSILYTIGRNALNGEILYSMKELRVLAERWPILYNTVRPYSSLRYKPPAPAACLTEALRRRAEHQSRSAMLTGQLAQDIGQARFYSLFSGCATIPFLVQFQKGKMQRQLGVPSTQNDQTVRLGNDRLNMVVLRPGGSFIHAGATWR